MNRRRTRKGFTLLELLMVVIILAILAAIALPQFLRAAERSRASEALSVLGAMRSAQQRFLANNANGQYAGTGQQCNLDIDLPGCGTNPASTIWVYAIDLAAGVCLPGTGAVPTTCHGRATRLGAGATANDIIQINLDTGVACVVDGPPPTTNLAQIYGLPVGGC